MWFEFQRLVLCAITLFVYASSEVPMENSIEVDPMAMSTFPFRNGSSAIQACSPCYAGKCSFTVSSKRNQTLRMTTTSTSTTTTTGTTITVGNSTTSTVTSTTTSTSTTTAFGSAEVLAKIGASVAMAEH